LKEPWAGGKKNKLKGDQNRGRAWGGGGEVNSSKLKGGVKQIT